MAKAQWLSLLLLAGGSSQAEYKFAVQDPILEKEHYAAACPDYRSYSMYAQYV